jgi:riboflavin biosynthesis pyrimidine reductase
MSSVGAGPGNIAWQALNAGLIDEGRIGLAPVLLGGGNRMSGELAGIPLTLDTPRVIEGTGITHLIYNAPGQDLSQG